MCVAVAYADGNGNGNTNGNSNAKAYSDPETRAHSTAASHGGASALTSGFSGMFVRGLAKQFASPLNAYFSGADSHCGEKFLAQSLNKVERVILNAFRYGHTLGRSWR